MIGKMKNAAAAVCLALSLASCSEAPQSNSAQVSASGEKVGSVAAELPPGLDLGKPAPDFTLSDSKGKSHKLSDYKGKFVVLEWVNFECPFVQKHYSSDNMQQLQKKYTGKDVVWLSINSSADGKQGNYPAEKIEQLISEKKAQPTAYLIDADGTVGQLYHATSTPHMFIIDKDSNLAYRGAIDDNNSSDAEDAPKAKNYVAAALDQAMDGKPITTTATQAYGCSVKYKK